jgi:hypothetical protein
MEGAFRMVDANETRWRLDAESRAITSLDN